MPRYSQRIIGIILLTLGLIFLIAVLFDVNFWMVCWPSLLILVGLWYLFRPSFILDSQPVTIKPFGDIKQYGTWKVADKEIWMFVGDVKLDLSRAEIPTGLTTIRIYGFVGDVDLLTTADIGVSVSANGFVTDAKLWGTKQERFLSGIQQLNPAYSTAEKQINLETYFFVLDLSVDQLKEEINT